MSWSESWWVTRNIVKSIQKGKTTSAQTVTINRVDMTRSIVLSVSKGSAGYVASRGTISSANLDIPSTYYDASKGAMYDYRKNGESSSTFPPLSGTISSTTISGGETDLTVKQYSATLASPTTLVTDGACEWQVIEFY